ncbi:MAG: hypothetical protein AVDCRST_MAG16-927, partial [uncultured Frankineae bacterium]
GCLGRRRHPRLPLPRPRRGPAGCAPAAGRPPAGGPPRLRPLRRRVGPHRPAPRRRPHGVLPRAAARRRAQRVGDRPRQPAPRPRRLRGQVGPAHAGVRTAGLDDGHAAARSAVVAAARQPEPAAAGPGGAVVERRARAGPARTAAGGPRRPRVRRPGLPHAVPRRDDGRRPPAAAARGAARTGRPQRDLQRVADVRPGARAGPGALAAQDAAHLVRGRHGGQPGRAGHAALPAGAPGRVRRPVPAEQQLLPPGAGRAGERLRALPAHHGLRRRRPARGPRRGPRAGRPVLRADRGERRQQPPDDPCAAGPGLRHPPGREPGRAHLHRLARHLRPAPRRPARPGARGPGPRM